MHNFTQYLEVRKLNSLIEEISQELASKDDPISEIVSILERNNQELYNELLNWLSNTRLGQAAGQAWKAGSSAVKNPVWPRYLQSVKALQGLTDILHRNGKNTKEISNVLGSLRKQEPNIQTFDNEIKQTAVSHGLQTQSQEPVGVRSNNWQQEMSKLQQQSHSQPTASKQINAPNPPLPRPKSTRQPLNSMQLGDPATI